MPASTRQRKERAMQFYRLAFEGRPREAMERYAGAKYIQHNPSVKDGKVGFIAYFERMQREYPKKSIRFLRSVAEGDLVALHSYQIWPGKEEYITMDFFRFDAAGKIVEHWDAIQRIPETAENDNGMCWFEFWHIVTPTMDIILNEFLFFWAFTLSFGTPVYNQSSSIQIDLEKQRVYLRYDNLYYEKTADSPDSLSFKDWEERLERLNFHTFEGSTFKSYVVDLKYCEGKAFLCIQGGYEDEKTFLEALYFQPIDSLASGWTYQPFSQEELEYSNAQKVEGDVLIWNKPRRYLKLRLRQLLVLDTIAWDDPLFPIPAPEEPVAR